MRGDSALFRPHQYWLPVVCVHGHEESLIFPFALEVHPRSQEYGQHHPPAQTVQPFPVSDCPNQLEVCGGSAEGMPQQGELWTLLNVYFLWQPR